MPRPPLEVADLVRTAGERFLERSRGWLSGQHLKVLSAIARCRTAALGGHLDECDQFDESLYVLFVRLELEVGLADQARTRSVGQEVGQFQVERLPVPAPRLGDDEREASPPGCEGNQELAAVHSIALHVRISPFR